MEIDMAAVFQETVQQKQKTEISTLRLLVFRAPNQIGIEQVPITKPGPGEAVIRVTLTTITEAYELFGQRSGGVNKGCDSPLRLR